MTATLQERLRHGIDIARAERSTIPENHRLDKLRLEAAARIDALEARERELVGALRDCVESLTRLPDVDGAYRVTCIAHAKSLLAPASAEVRK